MKQEDHARNGRRYITAEYLADDFKHFKMFVRWVFAVFFYPLKKSKVLLRILLMNLKDAITVIDKELD